MYLPGKGSELYSWSAYKFLPSRSRGSCGIDVMSCSTGQAIYPPFVLLCSFKKANSLKADWEREREGGGRDWKPTVSSTSSGSSWLKHPVYIISTFFKWEASKSCIQYLMNLHKKMKAKGSVPFKAGMAYGLNMGEGWRSLLWWLAPEGISLSAISSCK